MTKIAKLTESIRERIQTGEWKGAQSLPSRMLLSEEYGVAPGTISQVFRNLEQEGLVRVLPRKGVLLTDGQPAASASPAAVANAIGLRGSYVQLGTVGKGGYKGLLVNQLLGAAHERGVPVLILQENPDEAPLTRARCEAMGIRGMIYLGRDCAEEARQLRSEGFPVINGNRPLERSPMNYVDCDHIALIREVVSRCTRVGHKRIAVIMQPTDIPGLLDQMRPYFIEALFAAGVLYDVFPYWISLSKSEQAEERQRRVEALFELPEPPTAVFTWGAGGVDLLLPVLEARGLRVASDVSICHAAYSEANHPELSGFSYQEQNFGKKLLDGLMATIRNPFHFVQEELPFTFIDKGSIVPPAGAATTDSRVLPPG